MIKKLSKHGNSLAILIDKPITVPIISKDPKTQKIYEELVVKYDALFKKLSKN